MIDLDFLECSVCSAYRDRRSAVLAPAMAAHVEATGEPPAHTVARYMTGVHVRHLAGLSLDVEPPARNVRVTSARGWDLLRVAAAETDDRRTKRGARR